MSLKNSLKNHEALGFEPKRPPTKAPRGGEFDPARTNGLSLSPLAKDKPRHNGLNSLPSGLCLPVYA